MCAFGVFIVLSHDFWIIFFGFAFFGMGVWSALLG
jgi:hypothetical protein